MGITLKILRSYLRKNWIIGSLIFYELCAVILNFQTGINLTIPCIYSTFFDVKCPGCGLTSATILLIKGQFIKSFDTNPLVAVVIPSLVFFTLNDFKKFSNSQN